MDARVVYDGDLLRMYLAQPDQPWEAIVHVNTSFSFLCGLCRNASLYGRFTCHGAITLASPQPLVI